MPRAALRLNDGERAFVASSPLCFLMTGSQASIDVSPRGDAPGFIGIAAEHDAHTLLLPDRIGNNRIDSLRNIVDDARVALVCLRPDDMRMLLIEGRARIDITPAVRAQFAVQEKLPRAVLRITPYRIALSDAPALHDADFWEAGRLYGKAADTNAVAGKPQAAKVASLGQILADQVGGMTAADAEAFVAHSYQNKLY